MQGFQHARILSGENPRRHRHIPSMAPADRVRDQEAASGRASVRAGRSRTDLVTRRANRGIDLGHLLRATSRTFALGIELLRPPLREQVRTAYLVLRVSDYLEDNRVMEVSEKVRLLRLWHEVLHQPDGLPAFAGELGRQPHVDCIPDAEALRHAGAIVEALAGLDPGARAAVVRYAGASTLGMARWVERGPRFGNEADLDDYMHEVAGRVGHLLTELFALHSRRVRRQTDTLMGLGREFGLALQTVNVIRGLSSDRDRGWIFVPRTFLPPAMDAASLFEPANAAAAMQVLALLVAKAERHFASAVRYVTLLPRTHVRTRLFCLLPLLFGVKTLAVSRENPRVLCEEVKISRRDVRAIARRTRIFNGSNTWVRWYAGRLLEARGERLHRRSNATGFRDAL